MKPETRFRSALHSTAGHITFGQLLSPGGGEVGAPSLNSGARTDSDSQIDSELALLQMSYGTGDYDRALRHGLRALILTSRVPMRRGDARWHLAEVFLRTGDLDKAERIARKSLAERYATGGPIIAEARLLDLLGRIYRRQGALSLAIQSYEQAIRILEQADPTDTRIRTPKANLALSLAPKGEFERAWELIEEITREPDLSISWRAALDHLLVTRYAEYATDWDLFESSLRKAERYLDQCDFRTRILMRVYRARAEIASGRPAQAIEISEELLRECRKSAPLGDIAPVSANLLADALFEVGRYEEALQHARLASKAGKHADVLEWAASLRIAGKCLAALGKHDSAASTLVEALMVVQKTELVVERSRIEETMARLGLPPPNDTCVRPYQRTLQRRRPAPIRMISSGGRSFLTHDLCLVSQLRLAASDRLPVLLEGETGTGKELAAHLIHDLDGAERPFVIIDCTSLSESLAEVELFGAARGAYTGAVSARSGLVASANGGTLFLDELPELPLSIQSKLLRLLQEGTYRSVGEDRFRRVSARIIASTNRDVEGLLSRKLLKPDLFYRLNGHRVRLSPLRETIELIESLAIEFARVAGLSGLSSGALRLMKSYSWPGNVRELEMFIRRAASSLLKGAWLEESLVAEYTPISKSHGTSEPFGPPGRLSRTRRDAEREALKRAIELHPGNMSAAARSLSMSRQGLYKALKRTGLV